MDRLFSGDVSVAETAGHISEGKRAQRRPQQKTREQHSARVCMHGLRVAMAAIAGRHGHACDGCVFVHALARHAFLRRALRKHYLRLQGIDLVEIESVTIDLLVVF